MNILKTFNFGKVDYNKVGRKLNLVEVELEIHDFNGYDQLSIRGAIWNARKTDSWCCGQNLDEIKNDTPIGKNKQFLELYRLWKSYHLHKVESIPLEDRNRIYELLGLNARN